MMSWWSCNTMSGLNSLFSTPSIAAIIEPTASKVASLLPGETTVSPSKNTKPFCGKAFSTAST